ncbi:MAG: isochorismatase family cysteine hydrolase [Pseudomonadota bacterium]
MTRYTDPVWEKSALITIDTQVDTLDGGPMEIPGTTAVLPKMRRVLDLFRKNNLPVVHIVRLYLPDGSNVDVCRRAKIESGGLMLAPNTPGSQLAPGLFPGAHPELDAGLLLGGGVQELGPREMIIYKSRWGAFYRTPLEERLRNLEVDTLVFCGCNFPNCPRTSIYEAGERDFRLVLVRDAISGLYAKGEQEMENTGVVLLDVVDLEKILGAAVC